MSKTSLQSLKKHIDDLEKSHSYSQAKTGKTDASRFTSIDEHAHVDLLPEKLDFPPKSDDQ